MSISLTALLSRALLYLRDFLLFFFAIILPRSIFRRFLPHRDHFAAHTHARFEGYYTRVQTADNSSIVIIFSSVPHASSGTSHFVHFSLTPSKHSSLQPIRVDEYPREIKYSELGLHLVDGRRAFCLRAGSLGTCVLDHDTQTYALQLPDPDHPGQTLHVSVDITSRTPLKPSNLLHTPHGRTVHLGSLLPLHWHIFSTHSTARYVVRRGQAVVAEGCGAAHMEKNWGRGFPDSWTWFVLPVHAHASPPFIAPLPGCRPSPRRMRIIRRRELSRSRAARS